MGVLTRCVIAFFVALATGVASGCTHVVRIVTEPEGANVIVDGEAEGPAPVIVERRVFIGDTLRVAVEAEGYEPAVVTVPASEWYPWPGLLALVPLLGVPLSLPALLIPVAGLVIAPAIAITWAVVTSPTLLGLALTRKYPDTVTVKLKRRSRSEVILPSDIFYVPDDATPNPIPEIDKPEPPARPPDKRQPAGANPVP